MSVQEPKLTIKRSAAIDEKIRSIYVNYLQLMLDAAKDETLKKELFSSNAKRIRYLNEKVGMKIPAGVHVMFKTKGLRFPKIFIKDKDKKIWIDEGSEPFKIIEKLNNGESVTESMKVTKPEEIDMEIHEAFKDSFVVLKLPFLDPTKDLTLFELKYEDTEIILTTCAA